MSAVNRVMYVGSWVSASGVVYVGSWMCYASRAHWLAIGKQLSETEHTQTAQLIVVAVRSAAADTAAAARVLNRTGLDLGPSYSHLPPLPASDQLTVSMRLCLNVSVSHCVCACVSMCLCLNVCVSVCLCTPASCVLQLPAPIVVE